LDTSGGERELSAYSKTKSVVASIPKGYALTTQQGSDFIVHHINKFVSYGDERASIGVYLGDDHPSNNRDGFVERGRLRCLARASPGIKEWTTKVATELITDDATVPLAWSVLGRAVPGTSDGLTAASASSNLELKSIASTFRLADRNAH
jgi:hypothetical protein